MKPSAIGYFLSAIAALLLGTGSAAAAASTNSRVKIYQLTSTNFAHAGAVIIVNVSTNEGDTMQMSLSNLLNSITTYSNWTASAAGGAATNAVATVKSNGVTISSAATSLDFIESATVSMRATNAAGAVTVQLIAVGEVSTAQLLVVSNLFNNRQFGQALLSNLVATGVAPGATNPGYYISSAAGRGSNITHAAGTNLGAMVFKAEGGSDSFDIFYAPSATSLIISNTIAGLAQLELSEVGTVVSRGSFAINPGAGLTGTLNVAGAATLSTNAIIAGTNRANWVQITGGQAGQGVFAIFDNNTNLVGWIGTNVIGNLNGATNGLNTAVGNLQGATNGLNTRVGNLEGATNGLNTAVGNLQGATNGLNTAVGNLQGATNGLNTRAGNLEGATNGLNSAMSRVITNYLDLSISNATSKPLVFRKNNQMLEMWSAIAGANIALTMTTTGIVFTSTGASLSDGDYGDVTATGGGATITIDNDVVTDAKLRESAGFSVIGKTDTGTGNPADIAAAADGVLRRSGSGNLQFGSLVTANYGDDSVTFAKFQNVAENRILGRDSTGAGNVEELTAGLGLDITGGSFTMLGDQVLGSGRFTNSVTASNVFARSAIVSNSFEQGFTNTALTTNIALNWNGPPVITSYPTSTTFMLSFVGTPAASNGLSKWIEHFIIVTNSPTMVAPSGAGWVNPPVLTAGTTTVPSTNRFLYKFEGNTNVWAWSGQDATTGTGATVLSNSPSLYAPKIVNATASRLAEYDAQGLLTNSPYTSANVAAKQDGSQTLTNLAGTGAMTNMIPGWGTSFVTNSGIVTVAQTNRPAGISTNATSTTVGFSDAENVNIYNAWFHLTTNLVVSPTNLIVGRTICVRFDTNALTYDVVITNTAANPVNWNLNVSTNGSTSFTKTNSLRARVYLTAETNGVISADFGYYR